MSKWISVKDRLPKTAQVVSAILRYSDASAEVTVAVYAVAPEYPGWSVLSDDAIGGWIYSGDYYGKITHWMPLPELPEEGE